MHNAALRTATGCTQDTNIQHLHDKTLTLPYTSTHSSIYIHLLSLGIKPQETIKSSSSSSHQTSVFHLFTHFFAVSLNLLRSSNEQGCARRVHCIMGAVFSVAQTALRSPISFVVPPSLSLFLDTCESCA